MASRSRRFNRSRLIGWQRTCKPVQSNNSKDLFDPLGLVSLCHVKRVEHDDLVIEAGKVVLSSLQSLSFQGMGS
jgi:hypothetical protein